MSCPDERLRLMYAEDALEDDARHAFEMHLVSCRSCRRRVVALRDEAQLLADVLRGRERAAPAARPAPVRGPGFAVGLASAVAGVTLALSAAGFLLEARMPGGLDVLNPLRLKGAYEMAFDLVFWIRDRAPGVLELAVSLGVLASVAALLSFAAGALYRRLYGATTSLLLAALGSAAIALAPPPAEAVVVRTGDDTRVSEGERVEEAMLLSCDVVWIDGVVEGDVVAVAERMTLAGEVKGSLYLLVRELEITGTVTGNVHGVVEELRVDGVVEGSVYALSETLTLGPEGRIVRDLGLVAEEGLLGGRIGRDVLFGGDVLELRSEVGRDVDARWVEQLFLRDGARIGGDVEATLREAADLDRAPGAQVAGVVRVRPREPLGGHYLEAYRRPGFYLLHGLGLVAALVFGVLLRALAPGLFRGDPHSAADFFRALGVGFLALVATPVAILLLALTLVGIPVAALVLFTWIAGLYTAEITVGAWLGRRLWPPRNEGLWDFTRALLVGLPLLTVAGHVPFVGPAVSIVALIAGLGLLVERGRHLALPVSGAN